MPRDQELLLPRSGNVRWLDQAVMRALCVRNGGGERAFPELVHPGAKRPKSLRIDRVDAPRALASIRNQAGILENLDVTGRPRAI